MATEPGQPTKLPTEAADGLPESLWSYDFLVPEERAAQETPTGLVDLGYLGAAWRRSRRLWVSFAVVGFIIGAGLFVTMKPGYSATANVILTNDPALDAPTAIQNASEIAQEPAVAKLALKNLGLPGDKLPYSVTVVDYQILSISLSAPTGAEAVREVDAVANAFLTIRNQADKAFVTATLKGESAELAQDQQAVKAVDEQLSQVSATPTTSAQKQQVANLQAQRTAAADALATLQQKQTNLKLTEADMRSGSSLLSTSLPVSAGGKKVILEYVAGPFFGALVLGLGIVAVRAVLSDRLFRRDDVAVALDAPVRVSVSSTGSPRESRGKQVGRETDLNRVAEFLRSSVPVSSQGPAALVVAAVDDPDFAATALVLAAGSYAREGKRVAMADLAGGALAKHFEVTESGVHAVDTEAGRAVLVLPDPGQAAPIGPRSRGTALGTATEEVAATYSRCDIMLTLALLDLTTGADHLATWSGDAVAVITAGASSVARVQSAGEMIRHAGVRLVAGILLGADKKDESLGLVTA